MAALINASILTPSDAFKGEMLCRTDFQIGWYLIIGVLIWLCGVCVGARMMFSYGTRSSAGIADIIVAAASSIPKPKAKRKAIFRASGSDGAGSSSADPLDVPAPDLVLSTVVVTEHGQRYHRRVDCHGLTGARKTWGPYSACMICANGPYRP
jgi:hypothetical protein